MHNVIELNPAQIYKVAEYLRNTAITATNTETSKPIASALHCMADKVLDIYNAAVSEARALNDLLES